MKHYLILLLCMFYSAVSADDIDIARFSDQFSAKVRVEPVSKDDFHVPAVVVISDKSRGVVLELESSFSRYEIEEGALKSNVSELPYGEQSILISDDFNFDGVLDLAVRSRERSCYGGPAYVVYLNKSGRLIHNSGLTRLATEYCGMFDVDKEQNVLRTMTKSGCCWHEHSVFKMINDKPTPLEVIELDHQVYPFFDTLKTTWHKGKKTLRNKRQLGFKWNDEDKKLKKLLSFTIKENKKQVLLFVAGDSLFYALLKRNGKDVEFSYPRALLYAEYKLWDFNTDEADVTKLTFINDGATYEVYERRKDKRIAEIGIKVVAEGKKYRLEGDISTVEGQLDSIVNHEDIDEILVKWKG